MSSTEDAKPLGLGCTEGLGPLRELAQEGAALHSPGMPERAICDGLLVALDEIDRLRTELLCAREDVKKWQGLTDIARTLANLKDRGDERAARLGLGA